MSVEGGRAPMLGREAYRVWRDVPTRWADNDVYGHVNNVVFFAWFDTVVNAWLIESGLLVAGAPIGLVAETGCRYASPLAFPDKVEVGLAVAHVGRSSVIYRLGIFAENCADPAAEGRFVHVYVDRDRRRPVVLPASWRHKLAEIALAPAHPPSTSRSNAARAAS